MAVLLHSRPAVRPGDLRERHASALAPRGAEPVGHPLADGSHVEPFHGLAGEIPARGEGR